MPVFGGIKGHINLRHYADSTTNENRMVTKIPCNINIFEAADNM